MGEWGDGNAACRHVASRPGRACDRRLFVGFYRPKAHASDACHPAAGADAAARDRVGQSRIFLPRCSCFVACLTRNDVSALGATPSSGRGDRGAPAGPGVYTGYAPSGKHVQAVRLAAEARRWTVRRFGHRQGVTCRIGFRIELLRGMGAVRALGARRAGDACRGDSGSPRSASWRGLVQRDTANICVRVRFLDKRRRSGRGLPRVAA